MGKLLVIGLGSTDINDIKDSTLNRLKDFKNIYARTINHEAFKSLKDYDIKSFDSLYMEEESIDMVDERIAEIISDILKTEDLVYLVPGSPFILEKSVKILKDQEDDIEFINNTSAAELVIGLCNHISEGYKTISGKDLKLSSADYSLDLVVQEIDNEFLLDEVITILKDSYPGRTRFSIVKDGGLQGQEIYTDTLDQYRRKIIPNHQTSILVYRPEDPVYGFSDLVNLTDTLRGPDGCPWDIEQTHESMKYNLVEETYEVIAAIEEEDYDNLNEELGDLLFQVIIHSQIAYENGDFSILDVVNNITNKLIYRHPHVFSDLKLDKSSKVLQNWDSIKFKSKNINFFWERLYSKKNLPSTIWSYDIIDKVTRIGFDWEDKNQALEKVLEEYLEVKEALNRPKDLEEELGDLLFTVINLSHYLGYEPEGLLKKACEKFVSRFKGMENIALKENQILTELGTSELERLWQLSKQV